MHRSTTLPKLLALFISGSILFSSVPVYAEETTSLTEFVTEEVFEEPDYSTDNSDEDVNGFLADEDMAGESLTDTVDENRETPAGSDSGSTTGDGSNTLDSRTDGNEANVEDGCVDSGTETAGNEANVEEGCADSGSETAVNEANIEEGSVDSGSDTTVGGSDTPAIATETSTMPTPPAKATETPTI